MAGKNSRRTGCAFLAVALVALLLVGAGTGFLLGRSELQPVTPNSTARVDFVVNPDDTLDQVTTSLHSHSLIKSTFWFGMYAKFRGLSSKLVAGTFELSPSMGASEIITVLEDTPAKHVHKLVVTEGMRATQIADAVASLGIGVSAQQYMDEVNNGKFDESFLVAKPASANLEGFLFPDTYSIPDGTTAHGIVDTQLKDFAKKAQPPLGGDPAKLYANLIVASLVEREAKFAQDRPLVAGVIANRLNTGMVLGIDASVEYGLDINNLSLTQQQLATDTPYNTYIHSGLPPTPISNPGLASLQAAISPAATPYLYYVSDGCGHIHYSVTAADHDTQVQQYVGTPCSQ